MFKKLVQYYQIFCNLSLDIVFGVICCMLPLPICFNVHVNMGWYLGLPAATWLIYLTDHLIDTLRNPGLTTPRHSFVRTYQLQIYILICGLLILCCYLAFRYYNIVLFLTAFTLFLFCLLYFLLTSISNDRFRFFYNKELMVAIIYATALYLSIGLSQHGFGIWLPYYISLLLITYLNLLTISIIEYPDDVAQKQFSWVVIIGKKRAMVLFHTVVFTTVGICCYELFVTPLPLSALAGTYLIMAVAHWFILKYAPSMKSHLAYRKLSEIIFWLPGILYLIL